jgi:hypothetical protein
MNSAVWMLFALVGMLYVDQTALSPDIEVLVRVAL